MSTILAVGEIRNGQLRNGSFEAFTAARQLAEKSGATAIALVVGPGAAGLAEKAGAYGISNAVAVEGEALNSGSPASYAAAVADVAKAKGATAILMSATVNGKDIMARVAAILDCALAQDCTAVEHDDKGLAFTRPMYAGKLFATVRITSATALATLRSKSVKAEESATSCSVETHSVALPEAKVAMADTEFASGGKISISEADILVSGGRGLKGPENWGMIEDLADALGAGTACSRPVSDEGWRPHGEHVGQTGITVSPDLYIACGISGAIQHIAGMSSSKYIVAINKDPEAPFFKVADYGIVGDVFEVLPAMIEEVKRTKS
ncbi:MAG: electron transfer flavoprotein subunit alpha/FixB family protein [Calditrichia bacterium]